MNIVTVKRVFLAGFLVVCSAAVVSGTAVALAGGASGGTKFDFMACDADKDGSLSRVEFESCMDPEKNPMVRTLFDLMDADNDGILTKEELKRHTEAKRLARESASKKHEGRQNFEKME